MMNHYKDYFVAVNTFILFFYRVDGMLFNNFTAQYFFRRFMLFLQANIFALGCN